MLPLYPCLLWLYFWKMTPSWCVEYAISSSFFNYFSISIQALINMVSIIWLKVSPMILELLLMSLRKISMFRSYFLTFSTKISLSLFILVILVEKLVRTSLILLAKFYISWARSKSFCLSSMIFWSYLSLISSFLSAKLTLISLNSSLLFL